MLSLSPRTARNSTLSLIVIVVLAIALSGCSRNSPSTTQTSPTIPDQIYALVGNQDGISDLQNVNAAGVRLYLADQESQSSKTDATQLYATSTNGQPFIPIFSSSQLAKNFVDLVFKAHHSRTPNISIIVMTQVKMNQSALYQRTVGRSGLAIVLDPLSPQKSVLTPSELNSGEAPQITDRTMVWDSVKGSNVDRAL